MIFPHLLNLAALVAGALFLIAGLGDGPNHLAIIIAPQLVWDVHWTTVLAVAASAITVYRFVAEVVGPRMRRRAGRTRRR